jgi:leader peptidase (prepilin peptidase)/N-methyltransferase
MLIEFLQAHAALAAGTAGVFGLLVGSFLNVVIYRLPVMLERDWQVQAREVLASTANDPAAPGADTSEPAFNLPAFNLIVPRSRCPSCAHLIRAHENIPLLSYALQRGRCRACGWRIPARYPVVELLTGVLSAIVVAHFGVTLNAVAALGLTYALVALAFIDLDTQYLPDCITLPLLWAGLAVNLAGTGTFATLTDAVLGAIAGYLSLWSIYWLFKLLTRKEGMGYGDFKLMAALGAWMGWSMLPATVLLSSLVGAVVGVTLIALRGHDRQVPIPFGPYIAAAGWGCLLWGEALNRLYLQALV